MNDHDTTPTPAEMLALLQNQQRSVEGKLGRFVPAILFGWGVAWLVGFLALWLADGGAAGFVLPFAVAAPLFAGLLLGAGVLSTVLGIRSGRGLRPSKESAFAGIVYGNLWWVGSLGVVVIGQALVARGMPADLLRVYYPSAFILFYGVMYVAAGLLWRALPMVLLGAWSIVVAAVAVLAPPPAHYLVCAIGGGGAFLLVAAWTQWWSRRARRGVAEAADG
ncbi:MAG: hypothetical protein QM582_18740 [Micropruina sp.]|uniref:hypothetical protein n=1 Tax=Micropruina sp. TaxID=2737536 RepID=UPI0039E34FB5